MKKNVGGADKWVRIILGAAIVILGLVNQSWWGLVGIGSHCNCIHGCLSCLSSFWDINLQNKLRQ